MIRFLIGLTALILMLPESVQCIFAQEVPLPSEVLFNRDIRPILSDNCFVCHGPDPKHREADLRLDVREDAVRAKAFIPGDVERSKLIERVLSTDAAEQMPPPSSHRKLSDRQKELLKRWVHQGANYQKHWSYEPPYREDIPQHQHPVDFLVRRRLAELDMQMSAQSDPRTLIRRLYFDLLGLPPTPEEVAEFVRECNDSEGRLNVMRANTAYASLVDRVLQKPQYGERMAIAWLDVVRFADTIGYHSDNPRNVWPYRDYVIRSFNDNKPFDRFTIEQIAGDLLPDKNQETLVGSAFNRLILSTEEGGAQPKDYESRMLTDRVRAIGTTWLGQTTGCAQCHDHKFDPFTMKDFYSLGAFFADIEEPIIGRREDGMVVGTEAEKQELARLDTALSEAKRKRDATIPFLEVAQRQWEEDVATYGINLPELASDSKASEQEKAVAKQVVELVKKGSKDRKPKDATTVETYFRNKVTKLYQEEREALAKAERERQAYYDKLPKCLVSNSTSKKRTVRFLPRGNWMDESGEIMKPGLPAFLTKAQSENGELTRLDLAKWIVSRENPLTARTVMNRLWKQLFGLGLSKVLDDLGAQGEMPNNLPLLDWLACEFMEHGWDMKYMVRMIVTSEAYRQSSIATKEQVAADPYNREFGRQSSFRLDAELVRDNALAIAGLLNTKVGGPSVKPYQPEGYWENLNFPVRNYTADVGADQYRRGLYTWWQRSFLHPSMLAFDAPSREECCAERNRSNIPQQALVLLNDPTYVEAACAFSTRIVQASSETEGRLRWAWQQAIQRNPREAEMQTMLGLIEQHLKFYQSDPKSAEELVAYNRQKLSDSFAKVELAVWTHVARVILNLHETITRP